MQYCTWKGNPNMTVKQNRALIILITCILLVILAAIVYLQQLNSMTETERAKEFLHTMYTVTVDESTELLACITSASLTEEMTNRPLRKKYERLMTRPAFLEAVASRAIWSDEVTLAVQQCVMTAELIQWIESEFSTPEKPVYPYKVDVKVHALVGQDTFTFQPQGTLYLEKFLTGWKISRILINEASSVSYQLQANRDE